MGEPVPTSFDHFAAEVAGFDRRREIVKAMTKGLRGAFPPVRTKIRETAVASLPARGGLGAWVAKASITVRVAVAGRRAGILIKGGRNSRGQRSDLAAIDRGRVRAPSWGRRFAGQWHVQAVPAGFFRRPIEESPQWYRHVDAEVDAALDQLRRG